MWSIGNTKKYSFKTFRYIFGKNIYLYNFHNLIGKVLLISKFFVFNSSYLRSYLHNYFIFKDYNFNLPPLGRKINELFCFKNLSNLTYEFFTIS